MSKNEAIKFVRSYYPYATSYKDPDYDTWAILVSATRGSEALVYQQADEVTAWLAAADWINNHV